MNGRQARNVSLTPELEAFIAERLGSGDYRNASEVVRAALRTLRDGAVPDPAPWRLIGGGECGALIRAHDWSATPLGPIERWPAELRVTVANIVNSPVAKVLMWGRDHIMLYNDAYRAIAGDRHPAALGAPVATMFPEVWDWNRAVLAQAMRGEVVSHRDQPIVFHRPEGPELLILELFYTPVHSAAGVAGVLCTMVDNSVRMDLAARVAASEAELRRVTDALPMLVSYVDRDQVYRFANEAYRDWFGIAPDAMIGRTIRDVLGEAFHGEAAPAIGRALAGETVTFEAVTVRANGVPRRTELRYVPHVAADGTVPGVHVLAIDVEERARREADVALSNSRFRTAMEAMHGVLWTNGADGRMSGEQPGWASLTGQSADEYAGYGWADAVHPDDACETIAAWEAAVAAKAMFVHEHRVRRHCGAWRTFAIRALPILDEAGEIIEWVGVHTDITHRRAAELALREQADALAKQVRHRERAEAQLRQLNETLEARVIAEIEERQAAEAKLAQAQKMETVGKLTGGIAHDFNNLLQVVSGNLQLLARDVSGNDRAERRIANAMAGVARGSQLAAQLLAFGRRQPLAPKVVNITRFVQGMDDMLRRAIGEAIEIEAVFDRDLWNSLIDPAQIENAILNLAINARDAMEGNGKLTIELANARLDESYCRRHDEVAPGDYVMVAVSDTGSGMPPEIVERVFEPFFSTKAEGKGSGLGLSMVYGFVKQSGGHVSIYSEVGYGTTIRLYLPRAVEAEEAEPVAAIVPVTGGNETVLVVEDDAGVRDTVVEMLTDLGYRVLKAVDAQSALAVIESGAAIDLLFTDVVMPGTLKSPALARRARTLLPDVAVLFTSGYSENSIVHGGRLDAGVELLSKPYTREALARKFRHVLANQRQRNLARDGAKPSADPAPALPPGSGATVLLVEDDALIRSNTAEVLQDAGYVVVDAGSAEEAMAALQTVAVELLVTDVNLPGLSGPDLAARARALRPNIAILYATGDAAAALPDARARLLAKPYGVEDLLAAAEAALRAAEEATGDAMARTGA